MILVVDPREKFRQFMMNMIKVDVELPCVGAGSAKELFWNLEKAAYELILVYAELPDRATFECIQNVRHTWNRFELPIILLVDHVDKDLINNGFASGINDFIEIPFNPPVVAARIRNQVNLKHEHGALLAKVPTVTFASEAKPAAIAEPAAGNKPIKADVSRESSDTPRIRELDRAYSRDTKGDRPVPCEMPVSLVVNTRTFFCKTIWITHHHMLLLTFEDFPKEEQYQVQLLDTSGSTIDLEVAENMRQRVTGKGAGVLKLNLRICEAPAGYDELFFKLAKAYRNHGISGLKAVLRGEETTISPEAKTGATVSFAVANTSLNLIKGTRYKYQKDVGKGGFASVVLVTDNSLKREVAMKVLNKDFSKLEEARYSFLCEAQIAAQFHHPNIVFVYEVGELFQNQYHQYLDFPPEILEQHPERLIYFTMQYVEGQTLTKWIREGQNSSEAECLRVLTEIVKALSFAHEKGVVHRDIKPDNILIDGEGHVVVTDFGIATLARLEDESDRPESEGKKVEVACTPKYASPEQLRGKEMDMRSDIYSFGVMAYEVLSGKAPFRGKTLMEVVAKQLKTVAEPLAEKRENINPELVTIVERCMAKKMELRFQETKDLLAALSQLDEENDSQPISMLTTMEDLVSRCITASNSDAGGLALVQLTAFLKLHKTHDNAEQLQEMKSKLTDTSFLNIVMEQNLTEKNARLLRDFISALDSNAPVPHLLRWFSNERERWKRLLLSELVVLSAGRDLMPLVDYGLNLPDELASNLLRGFSEAAPKVHDPIYFKWANHKGLRTQMELLRVILKVKPPEKERVRILEWFANAGGSIHADVRKEAEKILEERPYVAARA